MDTPDGQVFLSKSLSLASSCNSTVLMLLARMQETLSTQSDIPDNNLTLMQKYLTEIVANYKANQDFIDSLEKSFSEVVLLASSAPLQGKNRRGPSRNGPVREPPAGQR